MQNYLFQYKEGEGWARTADGTVSANWYGAGMVFGNHAEPSMYGGGWFASPDMLFRKPLELSMYGVGL